jgi:hypothetical protein
MPNGITEVGNWVLIGRQGQEARVSGDEMQAPVEGDDDA